MTEPAGLRSLPSPAELAQLPENGGERWNRLVFEKSPYLLQHAANPVDWWPWGEAAFAEARRRDVPVFLSIGYATCHWCHVMERESFEDPEAAAALNEAFVCVKVDREERPDVDHVYMTVTQAMTGAGGWPMTCVLTPDREAFFAGTYFPKHGRQGRPGVMDLAGAMASAWRDRRDQVLESVGQVSEALTQLTAGAPGGPLSEVILERAAEQLTARHDHAHGGFGHAPKFPTCHVLSLLVRWHRRSGSANALKMAERTLDMMRAGGIWDHVGFGFHRYSTDPQWLVPHFEKMLYDQALAVLACLDAHQASGAPRHAETARRILEYVQRDLTSPDGAFLSAEDADSEGEEGLFYLWTPAEVEAVLGREDAESWCRAFDVREGGNFRDEATGRLAAACIPHLPRPVADLAADLGLPEGDLAARLEASREKLLRSRARRIRPALDDKVLTDWNGLMIAAMSRASVVLGDGALAEAAAAAASFVLVNLRRPDGRLWKRWRDGESALPAVLDDHAFLAWGLLELHQATLDVRWLEDAVQVTETMLLHFRDEAQGGFFLGADDGEELPVRAKEAYDGALPSGNSVAAYVLLRLGRLLGRPDWEELADGVFRAFSSRAAQAPSAHAFMLWAVDFAVGPSHEIVVVGEAGADDTRALLAAARTGFRPNDLLLLKTADEDAAERLAALAPWTRDQVAEDGRATAYACRGGACERPTTSPMELAALLGPS